MLTVALTGGMGSGKSSVARILEECGAGVVCLDEIARGVLEPGGEAVVEVGRLWPEVVDGGVVDRQALADLVFSDPTRLARLNAIVHPPTWRRARRMLDELEATFDVAVVELALLAGSGREYAFHGNLVVEAPLAVRLDRLEQTRGMSRAEAKARIVHQRDPGPVADLILDNSGSQEDLMRTVRQAWDAWLSPYASNLARGERAVGSDRPPTPREEAMALARLSHQRVRVRRNGDRMRMYSAEAKAILRAGFVETPEGIVSANPAYRMEIAAAPGRQTPMG